MAGMVRRQFYFCPDMMDRLIEQAEVLSKRNKIPVKVPDIMRLALTEYLDRVDAARRRK